MAPNWQPGPASPPRRAEPHHSADQGAGRLLVAIAAANPGPGADLRADADHRTGYRRTGSDDDVVQQGVTSLTVVRSDDQRGGGRPEGSMVKGLGPQGSPFTVNI